jgi:hypothetical protein
MSNSDLASGRSLNTRDNFRALNEPAFYTLPLPKNIEGSSSFRKWNREGYTLSVDVLH